MARPKNLANTLPKKRKKPARKTKSRRPTTKQLMKSSPVLRQILGSIPEDQHDDLSSVMFEDLTGRPALALTLSEMQRAVRVRNEAEESGAAPPGGKSLYDMDKRILETISLYRALLGTESKIAPEQPIRRVQVEFVGLTPDFARESLIEAAKSGDLQWPGMSQITGGDD